MTCATHRVSHHKRFARQLHCNSLQMRHATSALQRSYQHRHILHTPVRLPSKPTHGVTAAAPQATEQASNVAATGAAASTLALSAVALRSATAKCAPARHAAQRSDKPRGKRSSFSAVTQVSISFESASHWPCSTTRATAPTTHTSSVARARPQPSALPPTALGHANGRAARWPRRGVVPQPSRHQRASPLMRRVCEQRGHLTRTGTQQRMVAVTVAFATTLQEFQTARGSHQGAICVALLSRTLHFMASAFSAPTPLAEWCK
ncbi:hypothetical protein, conserved in T. vivax [Trypanosoma vivax Y486]|uniref:Uncharacterized protein n=1 Tax=Trypanosoma vivax (strain Y486) TaxID=1055687 RepID=F9WNY6_TRYVY|nr:hypothetical protein, conserved in T. vivax [Trypanosoma vivax Y486]|eukprot:CCD19258.1 hypothetical protein, conserved in T. vivax [Trypanosoma vivax Y486]